MPFTTQTSDFWGWYLRHNARTIWRHMSDAGLDVFASATANNPQSFLQLQNILPAMTGSLNVRWGLSPYPLSTDPPGGFIPQSTVPNIVRTFAYNAPQDASDPTDTATTNLWIGTDNQHFFVYTDNNLTPFTGYGPSNFTHAGHVYGVPSRTWFYYANGVDAPRKVNPSYVTQNTDSLLGIALSCANPGSSNYQDYPCVLLPTSSGSGAERLTMLYDGAGLIKWSLLEPMLGHDLVTPETLSAEYVPGSSGSGTGMTIEIVWAINSSDYPYAESYAVVSAGTGYNAGDQLIVTSVANSAPDDPIYALFTVLGSSTGEAGNGVGSTGFGYASAPVVTVTDLGGSGSGAEVTVTIDPKTGAVVDAQVTAAGSGYKQAVANVAAPPSGGKQAYLVLYTQVNPNADANGQVVGVDLAGPMSFVHGRQYAVALQNSTTGHTSDVFVQNLPYGPTSGLVFNELTQAYQTENLTVTTYPSYVSDPQQYAGYTQLSLLISVPATGLDPQVDTVLLLATSDGGSLGTLYQVETFALSTFTLVNGYYTLIYYDTLPDSYNTSTNTYGVTDTLLEEDLWAFTDDAGDSYGILLNDPPPAEFLYPTLHQGRMFATDGKTIFFSKSLDEVTTSTGLITSKWEECWPGDYQMAIALNNESIRGLKSDGTNLHIGTEKNIYTLYGSDPSNFSVPSVAFAQVGILSHECWSVVYKEGQPAGFVWITPDLKVMYSDFSTYIDIGTPVYPILEQLDLSLIENTRILALTQGPWNLAVLSFFLPPSGSITVPQNTYLVWESRLGKWYLWNLPSGFYSTTTQSSPSSFVYQFPTYSTQTTYPAGATRVFTWRNNSSPDGIATLCFDPSNTSGDYVDGSYVLIPWTVQTSWQDFGDSTAIKVVNEIEVTSDCIGVPPGQYIYASLYGASAQGQFDAGGTLLKTGVPIQAPLSQVQAHKLYCAGVSTTAKYYSILFNGMGLPGQAAVSSFAVESYPMARI